LSEIGVCIIVNVLEFVPTAVVFMYHWYARGAVPVALTVNVAVWPVETVRLVGSEEIAGAVGGVFPPFEVEPQAQRHGVTAKRSTDNCSLALNLKAASAKTLRSTTTGVARKSILHQLRILSLRRFVGTCPTGQIPTGLAKNACHTRIAMAQRLAF
jgi:hypothetical protein